MRTTANASEQIAAAIRSAIASGDWEAEVRELLAADVVLDTSSEHGRRRIAGADAVVEHLAGPGPGEVLHWHVLTWPEGAAITFEWRGPSSTDRRRWYLRTAAGRVAAVYSYAARSKAGGEVAVQIPRDVLSRIGAGARRAPLEHGGNSGAALERVELADGRALIAKRVGPAADWLGRVTGDRGRTALLWEAGAFSRMKGIVEHGIVAVEPDGDGWWVLMDDLSATFLSDERRLTRDESRRILGAAARLHSTFAGDVPNGTTDLTARLGMSSPAVAEAERGSPDLLPKQLEAAWDAFADAVDDDVAAEVMAAAADPSALAADLLAAGQATLLHGDLRDDNLGLRDDAVVLLDWDLATTGTASVEFAWYLCHDAWRIEATHDEIEADYRAAEGSGLDPRAHELGMLSGLVQYGWLIGHSARIHPDPVERSWAAEELGWWVPRTRSALERTGGMPR